MTRWKEKQIVYRDIELSDRFFVQIVRENDFVLIRIAYLVDVQFDSYGFVDKYDQIYYEHICSYSSWHEWLSRNFNSFKFKKIRESFIY